ncbi:head-tail connector protein [Terrisporobacter hibernicus]|uniref:Head-tail connector protein n=1 Tax=Terrisporobacter hibernicus TaxID=2813371 RepID=A0AAX2ZHK4_9FIRM|nr:head-tail connector protein [Terrisporobacter hibernicus]UEL48311.1 head-tail connector protein [Terrisporobacter hibernicus]
MFSIKDINLDFIKHYLRIEEEFEEDDNEIEMFMYVAKEYLMQVCSLSEEEYLQANTLVPALLILVSEMYEYRSALVPSNTKANYLIQRYINTHRKFL